MPNIEESPIHKLHPTQITVGMIEVQDKARFLASLKPKEQQNYMQDHPMPAVAGPEGRLYLTDHHHLGRAAMAAGVAEGSVEVEADLSTYGIDEFWVEMDRRGWVHPLDENGVRHRYSAIPHHLEKLVDDVYRSLARYVRAAGGYEKSPVAFAEFEWADFFRRLIAAEDVVADFPAAVRIAVPLAKSERAKGLPGYRRP